VGATSATGAGSLSGIWRVCASQCEICVRLSYIWDLACDCHIYRRTYGFLGSGRVGVGNVDMAHMAWFGTMGQGRKMG
jgi:hypothetical protein